MTLAFDRAWTADPRHAVFDARALGRVQATLDWWAARGCTVVALPWMAPERAMDATRPPHASATDLGTEEGALVASGEQAFLWLDAQGLLPEGPVIGWTPCFRREAYDAWHHHYFLKAELFVPVVAPDAPHEAFLHEIMARTQELWRDLRRQEGASVVDYRAQIQPDGSWDLVTPSGLELGSYGIRTRLNGGAYVYGTALAEPRWTNAHRME